MKALVKISVG